MLEKYYHNETAQNLLEKAAVLMDERAKQYDQPQGERSMERTVRAFNAITGRELTEEEGWLFMIILKYTRFFQNPLVPHRDSVEDAIAYASLFGESALNKKE